MARTYRRDARGRFAGAGYQGQTSGRGSRLKSPGRSLPKGATIKASAPAGTLGSKRRPRPPAAPATPAAGNNIKRTSGRALRRQPLGLKANAVRAFNPKSPRLQLGQMERMADRSIAKIDAEMKRMSDAIKRRKPKIDKIGRRLERMNADAIAKRGAKGITGEIARMEISTMGGRSGAKAIQRRMQRAADAAARGSKPAAKARTIYANQLAFTGSGKPKAGKNNLRPGPRNTTGKPKRRRKPKK